jgi:hypothetical protein
MQKKAHQHKNNFLVFTFQTQGFCLVLKAGMNTKEKGKATHTARHGATYASCPTNQPSPRDSRRAYNQPTTAQRRPHQQNVHAFIMVVLTSFRAHPFMRHPISAPSLVSPPRRLRTRQNNASKARHQNSLLQDRHPLRAKTHVPFTYSPFLPPHHPQASQ